MLTLVTANTSTLQVMDIPLSPFKYSWVDMERFAVGFHDCHKVIHASASMITFCHFVVYLWVA